MNGVIAVVAYRPKRGKDKELLDLVRARVPTLRKEGLVTESNSQLSTMARPSPRRLVLERLPELRLLKMAKRWGSSNPDGRIYLNPELIRAPSLCVDYVIAHEVCHLKFPQHDKAFYRLLTQVYPNWRSIKQRLEESF
jgi:hypothetical protein